MNLKLEIELSKADILEEADHFKKQIDDLRPLPADLEGKVMQKLRLDWNYHSNAIEGNRLNYGETVAFLMEGITAKGKPLKDHLDIRGHNEAINFLLEIVKDTRPLSEADIRTLHKMILVEPYKVPARTADGFPTQKQVALGEYKTQPNHVQTATGETHYYASPEETPAKMQELMEWYAEVSANPEVHPVVSAALFHHKFVAIHPFDDGNGRLSRILMNLVLMQNGYPPVVIKMEDRQNYYSLLSRADKGNSWPFVEYIVERLLISMQLYLKAASGGDIEEDEDIDKEIALLQIDLRNKIVPSKKVTKKVIHLTIKNEISPLIETLANKVSVFNEFFQNVFLSVSVEGNKSFEELKFKSFPDQLSIVLEYLNSIITTNAEINSLTLSFNLLSFKNQENTFDVSEEVFFRFGTLEYSIDNSSLELGIFKFYGEHLSNQNINLILTTVIKNIKSQIDFYFSE